MFVTVYLCLKSHSACCLHDACLCIDYWTMLGIVGKTKQHSGHRTVCRTRNSNADQHTKIQYEPLRITEDDMTLFALCQTKATEVCMFL